MKIDSNFPGGNIVVEKIGEADVWLHQDLRDTGQDWFYWYFRVTGAEGRTVRFHFTKSAAISTRGPAVCTDEGKTWNWLGSKETNTFTYVFPNDARSVLFCMTMPYLGTDWARFLSKFRDHPAMEAGVLCKSRAGRDVEKFRLGNLLNPSRKLFITCRHHACETMASYALEGWISYLFSDEPEAAWMMNNVEILVIPFVDKDGCEDGDQGKARKPHDHNRDYQARIYPEVAAITEVVPAWAHGSELVGFDLHCPWLRYERNEMFYQVGSENPRHWNEQRRFSKILASTKKGPLPILAEDDLPYGLEWNTGNNFAAGLSCARWVEGLPETRLATSLEIPYADAHGIEVNRESARALGADLGRACSRYMQST